MLSLVVPIRIGVALLLSSAAWSAGAPTNVTPSPAPDRLLGHVVDDRGKPVAGATIIVASASDPSEQRIRSDAKGEFIVDLDPGEYAVRAEHSGHLASTIESILIHTGHETTRLVLTRAVSIQGKVRGPDGDPIADAAVGIVAGGREGGQPAKAFCGAYPDLPRESSTDPSGDFRFRVPLACGHFCVRLTQEGWAPLLYCPPHVEGQTDVRAELTLLPASVIRGSVWDPDDQPVVEAQVTVRNLVEDSGMVGEPLAATTDEEGVFRLTDVPGGSYRIEIVASEFLSHIIDAVAVKPARDVDVGMIQLEKGSAISGRVTDDSRTGIADVEVTAFRRSGSLRRPERRTTTESTGAFRIAGLLPGTYDLRAEPEDDYGPAEAHDVEVPAREIEITLDLAGGVSGTVVREDGGPLSEVVVTAHRQGRGGPGSPVGSVDYRAATGRFEVSDLPADTGNTYVVVARVAGYGVASSRELQVESGETGRVGELVVAEGATLAGRIVDDASEAPVIGATVGCHGQVSLVGCSDVVSDWDGRFSLAGLTPGVVRLVIEHPDYGARSYTIRVSLGHQRETELRISAGGAVYGFVRDFKGDPVRNVIVEAGPHGGPWRRSWTSDDGSYRLNHVEEGTLYLRRLSPLGQLEEADGRKITIRVGEERREDFVVGGSVYGTVYRSGNGVPGARVSVSTNSALDGTLSSATVSTTSTWTDSRGEYTLARVPRGAVTVAIETDGSLVTRRAVIPEVADHRFDVILPAYPIRGWVLDSDTDTGVAGAVIALSSNAHENLMIMTSSDPVRGDQTLVAGSGEVNWSTAAADGSFVAWVDAPGDHALSLSAPGYVPRQADADTVKVSRIALDRSSRVVGRLDGLQPGGPTSVWACLVGDETKRCQGGHGPVVEFDQLPGGSYTLAVVTPGQGLSLMGLEVEPGLTKTVDVPPSPSRAVSVSCPGGADDELVSLTTQGGIEVLSLLRMGWPAAVQREAARYVVRGLSEGGWIAHCRGGNVDVASVGGPSE